MRVIIISHGHPAIARGGGEIAAYNLYKGINSLPEHQAWFFARVPLSMLHPGTYLAQARDLEYYFAGEAEVEELLATMELGQEAEFASLLRRLKPDVIHFHHYYKVGIELIRVARAACPKARLIMTLHEFMAVCSNHGTMVKSDMSLCYQASPGDCAKCLPQRGSDWYFLRERYIKSFFALIDEFISPSKFLAERYADWGIPRDKIAIIENGIDDTPCVASSITRVRTERIQFSFFGQSHVYKGLDFILEAFGGLPPQIKRHITLNIHSSGLDQIAGPYAERVQNLMRQNQQFVQNHGPYDQTELAKFMTAAHWVILGSIWWENSPLVIQEAYKFGRPVICPDIGGMKEKVEHGKGGFHYRARDKQSLQELICQIVTKRITPPYEQLVAGLPTITSTKQAVQEHLAIYYR